MALKDYFYGTDARRWDIFRTILRTEILLQTQKRYVQYVIQASVISARAVARLRKQINC